MYITASYNENSIILTSLKVSLNTFNLFMWLIIFNMLKKMAFRKLVDGVGKHSTENYRIMAKLLLSPKAANDFQRRLFRFYLDDIKGGLFLSSTRE